MVIGPVKNPQAARLIFSEYIGTGVYCGLQIFYTDLPIAPAVRMLVEFHMPISNRFEIYA